MPTYEPVAPVSPQLALRLLLGIVGEYMDLDAAGVLGIPRDETRFAQARHALCLIGGALVVHDPCSPSHGAPLGR